MNENYDGQGKSEAEEIHGAMVAAVAALGASLAVWTAVTLAALLVFGG